MPLYLTESDVDRLADMALALEAVEESFRRQGEGISANVGRRRARVSSGALALMGAADPALGVAGAKLYAAFRGGSVRFVVVLFDGANGELEAIIEAGRLGELRTGAASGVSAKYLARAEAATLAIIGTGRQARTQLEAIAAVMPLQRVRAFSRSPANVQSFAAAARGAVELPIETPGSAAAAVRGADIIVAATNSATPVLEADWVDRGAHVVGMGCNDPTHAELDPATIAKADRVLVDDLPGAQIECGDLIAAARAGVFRWNQAVELGLVVAGKLPGRTSADEITLFESQGIALWDLALAKAVVDRAKQHGLGTMIGS